MNGCNGMGKFRLGPERLLWLMGFSTHEFMCYVDVKAPRTGVEMQKKRLIEWRLRSRGKPKGESSKLLWGSKHYYY